MADEHCTVIAINIQVKKTAISNLPKNRVDPALSMARNCPVARPLASQISAKADFSRT
jgi:BarA-like signal transduction histidine kinase